jgi:hypothetical protein
LSGPLWNKSNLRQVHEPFHPIIEVWDEPGFQEMISGEGIAMGLI